MSTKRIKTAHITNYYHKNSGGISTFYNQMLEYANDQQREMILIVPGETDSIQKIGDYAKIYFIQAGKSPFFDKRYRVIMPWQFILESTKVCQILIKENPDLIEVCDKYSLSILTAKIRKHYLQTLGRPMLVHFSCERMDDNIAAYVTKNKLGKWFSRRLMGNCNVPLYDFYVAVSPYIADEYYDSVLEKNNPGRSKAFFNWCWRFFRAAQIPLDERIYISLRGGPNEIFSDKNYSTDFQREIREELGMSADSKLLFYAGRISPEKNIEVLIEMMEVLQQNKAHDFRLVVAGDGPKADWFREEFEKRVPNRLIMLGHLIDKQKLANLYANCDVFVHPNPREPSGNGPLEAMASGAAVVAPNSGGLLSYATQENAWLVEPTGENFASAMLEIIENTELRKSKRDKAIQTAKNNSHEKLCEETFSIYEEIYQKFQSQKNLFVYSEKPKKFDFAEKISS